MKHYTLSDLVGTIEIAERLDVKPQTVRTWNSSRSERTGFPNPIGSISGVPIWDWLDVYLWAERTDRLPVTV